MIALSTCDIFLSKPLISINLFIIFFIMLISHFIKMPYYQLRLNILEGISIIALCISVYCGLFMVTDSTINTSTANVEGAFDVTTSDNVFLSIIFIGSHLVFFCMLLILFLLELISFIRFKFPKVYAFILFINSSQIKREKEIRANRKRNEQFINLSNDFFLSYDDEWRKLNTKSVLDQELYLDNIKIMRKRLRYTMHEKELKIISNNIIEEEVTTNIKKASTYIDKTASNSSVDEVKIQRTNSEIIKRPLTPL